jgi:hypothetical protein
MARKEWKITETQLGLLRRASGAAGEGVLVQGPEAISAQSLRRRGYVQLASRDRQHNGSVNYLAFITDAGRLELSRHG